MTPEKKSETVQTVRTISLKLNPQTPKQSNNGERSLNGPNAGKTPIRIKPKVTVQRKVLIPSYAQILMDNVSENVKAYLRNENRKLDDRDFLILSLRLYFLDVNHVEKENWSKYSNIEVPLDDAVPLNVRKALDFWSKDNYEDCPITRLHIKQWMSSVEEMEDEEVIEEIKIERLDSDEEIQEIDCSQYQNQPQSHHRLGDLSDLLSSDFKNQDRLQNELYKLQIWALYFYPYLGQG